MAALRVAVGQGVGGGQVDGDSIQSTAEMICTLMRQASAAGARLVAFTEGALATADKRKLSSDPDRVAATDWSLVDWSAVEMAVTRIGQVAAELSIWVVLGTPWREAGQERAVNSLLIIDDTGRIAARYDKRHLSATEANYMYAAGTEPVVVSVDGVCFGFLICIEALLPDLIIEYEQLGADAVVLSSFTNESPANSQDDQRALAYANMIDGWVLFAAPGIEPDQMPSGVARAGFQWLARGAIDGRAQVVVGDLDGEDPRVKFGQRHGRRWRQAQRERREERA